MWLGQAAGRVKSNGDHTGADPQDHKRAMRNTAGTAVAAADLRARKSLLAATDSIFQKNTLEASGPF